MNNKISFPELVDSIASLTNTSKRVSELFLKELFGIIKEKLEQGESVKIKNLGTFKVTEISARRSVNINTGEDIEIAAHKRVSFTPDKSLAEAINMPFEGFESIALDDNISEKDLETLSSLADDNNETITPPPFTATEDTQEADVHNSRISEDSDKDIIIVSDNSAPNPINSQETKPDELQTEPENTIDNTELESELPQENDNTEKENDIITSTDYPEYIYNEEDIATEKRISFTYGAISGLIFGALITLLAWFIIFGNDDTQINQNNDINTSNYITAIDTINQTKDTTIVKTSLPDSQSIPAEIRDTVRTDNFLTKMSRKHYGRYEFWVYIYEENKSKITNPNNVPPGLVVIIPPAEKYGIDKNDPNSVRKAKEMAEKIL
ncbi:MAG: hypothetical protein E7080_04785 [Bacteroidales bacterium]|nr:hypothetical protein [Bacteroidales bacterium]